MKKRLSFLLFLIVLASGCCNCDELQSDEELRKLIIGTWVRGGCDYAFLDSKDITESSLLRQQMSFNADGTTHICAEVHCKKIKVESGWCDFVFEKDYPLPSLYETEKQIKELGHMPGLPSQKEIERNGLDVGDALKGQVKLTEEMYLHMIQMRKEMDELKRENAELKKLINSK